MTDPDLIAELRANTRAVLALASAVGELVAVLAEQTADDEVPGLTGPRYLDGGDDVGSTPA